VDIMAWLRGLGLEQYEQAFQDNAIIIEILPKLTADDLGGRCHGCWPPTCAAQSHRVTRGGSCAGTHRGPSGCNGKSGADARHIKP
jgi:hypothetical protein